MPRRPSAPHRSSLSASLVLDCYSMNMWTPKRAQQQRDRRAAEHAAKYGPGAGDQRKCHPGLITSMAKAVARRREIALDMRAKILSRVDVDPSGCWIWTGAKDSRGYGRINKLGVGQVFAHRACYEVFVGSIPDGMCVCHRCDRPSCVNPSHLFVGTVRDNVRDMIAKGRSRAFGCVVQKGESHPRAKLSADAVREIRRRCASGERQRDVAAAFHISQTLVGKIHRRELWGDAG